MVYRRVYRHCVVCVCVCVCPCGGLEETGLPFKIAFDLYNPTSFFDVGTTHVETFCPKALCDLIFYTLYIYKVHT